MNQNILTIKKTIKLLAISSLTLSNLQAATVYSESTNGALSTNASAPTNLGILSTGDSDIIGQVGGGIRDHFTFSIATGSILDSITLVNGTGTNHFFGIGPGNTFDSSNLLISTLFSGTTTQSADFLDTFSSGGLFGGLGVSNSSLAAGDYSILLNETAAGTFDYQLRLSTIAVPEPSSSLLIALSGLSFIMRRSRK